MAKAKQHQRARPSRAPVERTSARSGEGRRDHPPRSAETPPPKAARPIAAAGQANIVPAGCEPQPEQNFELEAGSGQGAVGAGLWTGAQQGGSGRGVEGLVAERGRTHGDWARQSATAQAIKRALWRSELCLSQGQREALDLIAAKLARIVCGDPDDPDHWDDIAGYALLAKTTPHRL